MFILNNSKKDIILSRQKNFISREYVLDNMFGYMTIGKERKKQEDSLLILQHPLKQDFKLLSVADGMGGIIHGGLASNIALVELIKWFELIPVNYFYNEKMLLRELKNIIELIDVIIREKCYPGGTTLSLALITNNNVILINVGDSRIYINHNNSLEQIGKDHSLSWNLYERSIIRNKDDIRFHKKNNLITSRLGCESKRLIIDSFIISNNDYDGVYLFTDGVTDCISEEKINNIININKYNNNLCKLIVDEAIDTISVNKYLDSSDYYSQIIGGKDNATAICFIKNK